MLLFDMAFIQTYLSCTKWTKADILTLLPVKSMEPENAHWDSENWHVGATNIARWMWYCVNKRFVGRYTNRPSIVVSACSLLAVSFFLSYPLKRPQFIRSTMLFTSGQFRLLPRAVRASSIDFRGRSILLRDRPTISWPTIRLSQQRQSNAQYTGHERDVRYDVIERLACMMEFKRVGHSDLQQSNL